MNTDIIQPIVTILVALISGSVAIIIARIQSAPKETKSNELYVPVSYVKKSRTVNPVFILLTATVGGIFGYVISGFLSPEIRVTTNPTETKVVTTSPTYTSIPIATSTKESKSKRTVPTDISLEGLFKFDKEEINEEYIPDSGTYSSNEEDAKLYDNPSEVLDKFREWGRINSFGIKYQFKDVCDPDSQELYSGGSLYTSENGAMQAYEFIASTDKSKTTYISQTQDNSFGENTYITWFEGEESDCSTPYTYRGVTIRFHKYNVGVTLQYYVGKGQVADEKMLSSLIELARIVEYKINLASLAK